MTPNIAIEVKDLTKVVSNRTLLENINWQVQEGEHWAIFGMNGSGKTTLLSILAGFQAPTKGTVKILGTGYEEESAAKLRARVGFISSSYFGKIFTTESLMKVVLSGVTGGFQVNGQVDIRAVGIAQKMLGFFNLGSRADYPFNSLSKGEQQNVLIARAFMSNPSILLLDELTSGLDIFNRKKFLRIVDVLGEEKKRTIISVTHHPEEVHPMYKKSMILKDGRIFAQGSLPDMVKCYVGSV